MSFRRLFIPLFNNSKTRDSGLEHTSMNLRLSPFVLADCAVFSLIGIDPQKILIVGILLKAALH